MNSSGVDLTGGRPGTGGHPRPTGTPALELRSVSHSFGEVEALAELDLTLEQGEVVSLVGPSGCGKTTLLELIAGLVPQSAGRILVEGDAEPERRLERCAYMPQRDLLLPWLKAIDNAALALRLAGVPRAQARAQAHPLLSRLGLEGFERARPSELSGGMRQRVAFVRTLLSGRPLLLLDEPFAALDAITRADLQEWLLDALTLSPRSVVLVTHDVEEALFVADRIVVLSGRPGRPLLVEPSPTSPRLPRREAVTSPEFVAARERALEALGSGR